MSNYSFPRILAVLSLLVGSSLVFAADITGQVTLASGAAAKNAVVWLESAKHSKPMPSVVVDQRDMTFIPHVTVVTVGTTVSFPNHDNVFHNVFAEFEAKKFDLGMYPRGTTKKITFPKPGVVAMLCSVHSNMSAYIMVVDSPYHTVADGKGRFKIADLPPGDYTLHVWHEANQSYEKSVTVTDANPNWTIRTSHK